MYIDSEKWAKWGEKIGDFLGKLVGKIIHWFVVLVFAYILAHFIVKYW